MSLHRPSAGRILVGVDGSKASLQALEWALRQAESTGVGVLAVTAWEWPVSFGGGLPLPMDYDPTADAQAILQEAVEAAGRVHPDADVQTLVVEGHPAAVLVELSEGAELLVVGSRGHGEFVGMLLGSVSGHCVTNAHCPVVVIRDK